MIIVSKNKNYYLAIALMTLLIIRLRLRGFQEGGLRGDSSEEVSEGLCLCEGAAGGGGLRGGRAQGQLQRARGHGEEREEEQKLH